MKLFIVVWYLWMDGEFLFSISLGDGVGVGFVLFCILWLCFWCFCCWNVSGNRLMNCFWVRFMVFIY